MDIDNRMVKMVVGTIVDVDRRRWTATVQSNEMGIQKNVPLLPVYLGTRGNGIFHIPERESWVLLAYPVTPGGEPTDPPEIPIILGSLAAAEDKDDEEDDEPTTGVEANEYDGTPDFRNARPILNEGDIVLSGKERNRIILRNSGVIEIGTGLANRYYLPTQNIIRDMAARYEMQTAGGQIGWTTREGEEQWDDVTVSVVTDPSAELDADKKEDVTIKKIPTVLSFKVREFSQDPPIIFLEMGRVTTDGIPAGVGAKADDIIYKMDIIDPDPNKGGLKYKVRIDKHGNYKRWSAGKCIDIFEKKKSEIHVTAHSKEIKGRFSGKYGARNETISGDDETTIEGNAALQIIKNYSLKVKGDVKKEITGSTTTIQGSEKIESSGSYALDTDNYILMESGADFSLSSVGNMSQTVAGSYSLKVTNGSSVPANNGIDLFTMLGGIQIRTLAGNISIQTGPTALTPSTKIESNPITQTVNISSFSPAYPSMTGGTMETNPTGACIRPTGPGGQLSQISIDSFGQINLGPPISLGHGYVVTTLTHPVCYVTGLPILGADQVTAGGIPIPQLPGTPILLPSAFISTGQEML